MHREQILTRKAVLLVAFGTSVPQAQRAFDNIHSRVLAAFPETEIRWAYTSRVIRAKLAGAGRTIDSPELALARLMEEGFTHVAVLSLHVFPGQEFHDLHRSVTYFSRMAKGFRRVAVAYPLLSSYDDLVRTAGGLILQIPGHRQAGEAVLLMGHGNRKHPADMVYAALNHVLADMSEHVYVATVQGRPNIDDFLPKMRNAGVRRVFLIPFMAVAGEHARNDMAGEGPDSWREVLTRNGMDCEVHLVGIAENPSIVEIWLDHLREVFQRIER